MGTEYLGAVGPPVLLARAQRQLALGEDSVPAADALAARLARLDASLSVLFQQTHLSHIYI